MNDALAIYFLDVTIAAAFVARWFAVQRVEIVDGRDDEPTARIAAAPHWTPCANYRCDLI